LEGLSPDPVQADTKGFAAELSQIVIDQMGN
jgi:hypothetical protein